MLYPSIDKLLQQVGSKYLLVNVISKRSKEMEETNHFQMKDNEYTSRKNLGKALEEMSKNLINIERSSFEQWVFVFLNGLIKKQMFGTMYLVMSMKIEKIKKTGSKYKITLDNGEVINTYDDVIIKNNLLFDKNIDSELLNKLNSETIYYQSYNKALSMISKKLRSEAEIRNYFYGELPCETIDKIVTTLKSIGLINDKVFAKAYVNDKINLTLDGPDKIAKNLEKYKINEYIIEEVVNSIPREIIDEHLEKIINKKLKTNTKYSEYVFKQKLIVYLINLGYNRLDINQHLSNIKINNNFEKEMEKTYKNLSKKYDGEELYLKLKNKLYSKGFKTEEINNFINKNSD